MLTDHQYLVDMLARANMRYSIALHTSGSTILVNGRRNERPMAATQVTFECNRDGRLIDVKGE